MNFSDFENKKVWAVVGSIHNEQKYAYKVYKFLKEKGYTVYPVDPTGNSVNNQKTYTSLNELPEIPDAINMVINPVKGSIFLEEANNLNSKYIWFQPGAESEEMLDKAKSYGMQIINNNCVMMQFK